MQSSNRTQTIYRFILLASGLLLTIWLARMSNEALGNLLPDLSYVTATSSPPPEIPEWTGKSRSERWKHRGYKKKPCNGPNMDVLDHILCGHRHRFGKPGKSHLSKELSNHSAIRRIGNEVYGKGKRIWKEAYWEISHTFKKPIGRTRGNKPAYTVQLRVGSDGLIRTIIVL